MASRSPGTSRYDTLRQGGRTLAGLAWWVQAGLFMLGLSLFLGQARPMLSDAQFTWAERRVMGLLAVVTLGGCGLAGWLIARLLRVFSELIVALADTADASWRSNELLEQHLIPILGQIADRLEGPDPRRGQATELAADSASAAGLLAQYSTARAASDVGRAIDLRDILTGHLRGDPLLKFDRELAAWLSGLARRRIQGGTADAGLAAGLDRALESLGELAEAQPIRDSLPTVRRLAGLCPRCGRPRRQNEPLCSDCRRWQASSSSQPAGDRPTQPDHARERS